MFMKILQAKNDAACIEDTASLGEDIVVNMHHEVTTAGVLHHEADLIL